MIYAIALSQSEILSSGPLKSADLKVGLRFTDISGPPRA
jgi:hypothetical protein